MIAGWSPSRSSAMRLAAYETESVEPLAVAIGRFTFQREVRQARTISAANMTGGGEAMGKNATRVDAPAAITIATYHCAGHGSASHVRRSARGAVTRVSGRAISMSPAGANGLAESQPCIWRLPIPDDGHTARVVAAGTPYDGVAVGCAPDDRVALGCAPDDGVTFGCAPHDRVTLGCAPDDGIALGCPPNNRVAHRGNEHIDDPWAIAIAVAALGPPDDIAEAGVDGPRGWTLIARQTAAAEAEFDRLTIWCGRAAPRDIRAPRVCIRREPAARHEAVAPDDLSAPFRRGRWSASRDIAREGDGTLRVEEACPLGERVVAWVHLRRVLQNRFHLVGCERWIGLQHQRDRTADNRRRHARTALAQIRQIRRRHGAFEQIRRLGGIERAARIAQRLDADTGGEEVRLRSEIDRSRTTRAEPSDPIVGSVGCAHVT